MGAPFDSDDSLETGSVFVYKEVNEDEWELLGSKIIPADGIDGGLFGFSVDIDEDSTIVIGSRVSSQVLESTITTSTIAFLNLLFIL